MNKFFGFLHSIAFFFLGGAIMVTVVAGLLFAWPTIQTRVVTRTITPTSTTTVVSTIPQPDGSQINEVLHDDTTATLDVIWHKARPIDALKTYQGLDSVQNVVFNNMATVDLNELAATNLYETGVVRGGAYDAYKMLLVEVTMPTDIGGDYTRHARFIISPEGDRMLLLGKDYNFSYPFFTRAPNIRVPSLEYPNTITLENSRTITVNNTGALGPPNEQWVGKNNFTLTPISKTADGKVLYKPGPEDSAIGCVVLRLPDGQPVYYASVISELSKIAWDVDKHASSYEPFYTGGCGFHACVDVLTDADVGPMDQLKTIGTTSDGPIYAPKDLTTSKEVRVAYERWMTYNDAGKKPTFEEFIQANPSIIFYWKDSFNRWVRYADSTLVPQGECGKPVIYLYPEKTTNVSVRLPSFIRVTQSEPTYPSTGWNVVAHPDGTLDMKNGSYGSLYWEGTGVGYAVPKEGFLLKDGRVDADLASILSRYGLNEKESREFRDFWIPKMSGAPYYRVSFLTSEWSKSAPLFVSPRPTTAIRIFMDWQKLNAPISIQEPTIQTPVRNGFTLVEWGGLLRK